MIGFVGEPPWIQKLLLPLLSCLISSALSSIVIAPWICSPVSAPCSSSSGILAFVVTGRKTGSLTMESEPNRGSVKAREA